MYIVLYTSRLGVGGIQTFVLQLAEALQAYPEVQVAIFCHYPELLDDTVIPKGVELWTLSEAPFTIKVINKLRNNLQKIKPSFDLKEWLTKRYFFQRVKRHKHVVIHNNIQVGDDFVYALHQELGIPYITTLHGAYKDVLREQPTPKAAAALRQTLTRLLTTASSIVYLSKKNLEPFYKVLPAEQVDQYPNFERIYNGLAAPPPDKKVAEDAQLVFGMIARGHPDKGWLDLLEVAQELADEGHTNFELRLFADGDYVGEVMQQRAWSPQFQYFGVTKQPLQAIATFDVGLLPSYYEEMPFTIIEYLACGKPCIATEVGAIADMLQAPDGALAGVLLPLNAQETVDRQALKAAMLRFINDPTAIVLYEKAVAGAFKKFDLKHTAQAYYQLYKNAINQ